MSIKRSAGVLLLSVVLAVPTLSACVQASPDGRGAPQAMAVIDHHAPSPNQVTGGTYGFPEPIGTVTLAGGVWNDAATGRSVRLVDEAWATGDLYADGGEEGVALLRATAAGVETLHIFVLDVLDGRVHTIASTVLDSGIAIDSVRIDSQRIVVTTATGGYEWRLEGQQLVGGPAGA